MAKISWFQIVPLYSGLIQLHFVLTHPTDDAAAARKQMGAAASSALAQLSSLDDILGVAPIRSPPKEQVVPSKTRSKERAHSSSKDQVVPNKDRLPSKETVDVSMLQSSKSTHEVQCIALAKILY